MTIREMAATLSLGVACEGDDFDGKSPASIAATC